MSTAFKEKQKSLWDNPKSSETSAFTKASMTNITTQSGNGALKYTTTGDPFIDQFNNASKYKQPRTFEEVSNDMNILCSINIIEAVKLTFYLRAISRKTKDIKGNSLKETVKGQGLKNEGIYRMLYLALNYPDIFKTVLPVYIYVASWKDIITFMKLDVMYHTFENKQLDWKYLTEFLLEGIQLESQRNLVFKYLPQIKAKSKCTTIEAQANVVVAKYISNILAEKFGYESKTKEYKYKKYRLLKSSGTAHQWQQLISQKDFKNINFNTIAGRALNLLVSGKFLSNQGLENVYSEWLMKQPTAKFTGFPYEIFKDLKTTEKYKIHTYDKQFETLLSNAKVIDNFTTYLPVVDISGSMTSKVNGTNTTALQVAMTMALFFSKLSQSNFNSLYYTFSSNVEAHTFNKTSHTEALKEALKLNYIGSTNFQGIANKLIEIRQQGVSESEFPGGIICFSDGEFNSVKDNQTNYRAFMLRLTSSQLFSIEFISKFKIILWDIPSDYYSSKPESKFESNATTPNMIHLAGLDASIMSFLLGKEIAEKQEITTKELYNAVMSQEILVFLETLLKL